MILKDKINFSLWCDFIERDFLENQFQDIINNRVIHGATSNPAIFEQSISNSQAYSQQIRMLQANEKKKIYEELAITDIKRAAELLYPLYEKNKEDGFISIEVDPALADDVMGTIEEGVRLFTSIANENVMIKVPATDAGYVAMENLTSMGINVNATLIFTPEQAINCAQAFDNGINKSQKDPQAVISVFVSRFDRTLDLKLKSLQLEPLKTGIYNATKCYHEIQKFKNKNIRTLFASTGVKDNDLDADYYIKNLIYPNSVNTAPLSTIEAYVKNNIFLESKLISEDECDIFFESLQNNGINIGLVGKELLNDGLEAFKTSFSQMLDKLKER